MNHRSDRLLPFYGLKPWASRKGDGRVPLGWWSPTFPVQEEEKSKPDPLHGLRVHAWVLVLAGKREVPESFFIDPLTARSYSTKDEHFLGIESLWNHKNYWINMQDCWNCCKVRGSGAWG